MNKLYNHELGRTPDQIQRMKDLDERGVCSFCRKNLEQETTSPIEFETSHWVAKANDFPYERTRHHILLIPKVHTSNVRDLPTEAQDEFMPMIAKIEKKYKFKSFGVAMRSGDVRFNGGTVDHFHAHIIVGDTDDPGHEPVRFKLSSRPTN
jgi:ATP adenylyltransferase